MREGKDSLGASWIFRDWREKRNEKSEERGTWAAEGIAKGVQREFRLERAVRGGLGEERQEIFFFYGKNSGMDAEPSRFSVFIVFFNFFY